MKLCFVDGLTDADDANKSSKESRGKRISEYSSLVILRALPTCKVMAQSNVVLQLMVRIFCLSMLHILLGFTELQRMYGAVGLLRLSGKNIVAKRIAPVHGIAADSGGNTNGRTLRQKKLTGGWQQVRFHNLEDHGW
ncbi:PREDICTED: uncharacterized protein LOC109176872 [Ipomoea nil]|uniref:uncharacterized protein LOC109176872 n=1 Tax=Ipomoea nil TaxID=35883 RepID=UPI0009012B45|nr:PREDICTED: uncharacterized protein LOC109176872 [Ipomoea nil]